LVRGSVVVEPGASIILAPTSRGTGSVSIGGSLANGKAKANAGNVAAILGSIIVPGGTISIATSVINPGEITTDLAPGSLLSTAGIVVPTIDSLGNPLGTVLAGGSITLTGNILGEAGAVLDVSGATGVINLPSDSVAVSSLHHAAPVATRIDSNGRSLTLSATDALFVAATARRCRRSDRARRQSLGERRRSHGLAEPAGFGHLFIGCGGARFLPRWHAQRGRGRHGQLGRFRRRLAFVRGQ
jgi:hypothetical protein